MEIKRDSWYTITVDGDEKLCYLDNILKSFFKFDSGLDEGIVDGTFVSLADPEDVDFYGALHKWTVPIGEFMDMNPVPADTPDHMTDTKE